MDHQAGAVTVHVYSPPIRAIGHYEARADLIVRNAKITTLQPGLADAEALAVRGETFLAVGPEAGVMRLADRETRVVDAGGRRVIPRLNDSHGHAIRGGLRYNLEVRWDGVRTLRRQSSISTNALSCR
jgi:hypothetical protein